MNRIHPNGGKMYSKTIAVICPYYRANFSIPVGAKYKSAEAIAKGGNLPGIKTICPNPQCYREVFIHYI